MAIGFHLYENKRISFKWKIQLSLYLDNIIIAYKYTAYKKQESKDSNFYLKKKKKTLKIENSVKTE